ncbi:MAG: restriction endonuclease subunit S [Desulfurococcales archaeon]|nr:restriction endonuclease subunit S [Desulfurococcales archaeon]
MPHRTLDEYLKQATYTIITIKQHATKPKYRITGFYKETQFQETLIGKIPKEWQVVKLKELFDFQRGFSYRKKDISEARTSIRFITLNDMEKEGGRKKDAKPVYLKEELKIDNRFLLKKGDLLIANTDMSKGFIIGAPLYIDEAFVKQGEHLVYSMDLTKLIPKGNVNMKFFFYLLSWTYIRKIMKSFAQGTNVLHLNHNLAKNMNIIIPPLEEQWSIAEVLSSVDEAIETTERLIGRLERLKRGLMQELLTKGIGHREYKQTPIGKIPKEWQVVEVKELFNVVTGTTPSTKVRDYWDNGTINWITPQDLSKLNGKIIIRRSERKITEKALKDYHLALMPRGSIILSTRAPVGYVAVLEEPATFNQGCKGLILKKSSNVVPEFYAYYFTLIRPILEAKSGGSTFKELSKKALEETLIPYPPYEEQQKIASTIMSLEGWLEVEEKRKEKLERLKRGLMELLLTGRVRVCVERPDSEENLLGPGGGASS